MGGLLEIVTQGGVANFRHHINAGGRTVAIVNRTSSTTTTSYLLVDHLGSLDTVTDSSGNVVVKESFDPWGKRRNPATWSGPINGTDDANIANTTRRGFTGHTELDNFALVHMNGRVYDPTIGRFLSADPFIQFPLDTQSWNRFSYVLNNPLSLTDPSGYFSLGRILRSITSRIGNWVASTLIKILGPLVAGLCGPAAPVCLAAFTVAANYAGSRVAAWGDRRLGIQNNSGSGSSSLAFAFGQVLGGTSSSPFGGIGPLSSGSGRPSDSCREA